MRAGVAVGIGDVKVGINKIVSANVIMIIDSVMPQMEPLLVRKVRREAPIDDCHHLTRFVPEVISDDGSQNGIIYDGLHCRASGRLANAPYRD